MHNSFSIWSFLKFLMPHDRLNPPRPAINALEHKKRIVLSEKALERSRKLIQGARDLISRAKLNKETAEELQQESSNRRKSR